jgi:hypothetical protein
MGLVCRTARSSIYSEKVEIKSLENFSSLEARPRKPVPASDEKENPAD